MTVFKHLTRSFWFTVSLVILYWVLIPAGWTTAQDLPPQEITDDEVNAIAKQLYCPVCENVPLDVCPTQACLQWRGLIREKLAAGWSERQIKEYFVEQYGPRVLATPPARGFYWLVYLVPPIAILVGVYILYCSLRGRLQPIPESTPPILDDEYIRRLEEELKKE